MVYYEYMQSALVNTLLHSTRISRLRQFGIRLMVSLLLLSVAYGGGIALYQHQRHRVTPSQKLALLRSSVDQTLLAGSRLAGFSDTNSIAGSTINQEFTGFQASVTSLEKKLSDITASQLTNTQRHSVQSIIDQQDRAITSYKAAYQALAQPLAYDPYTDLANLNPSKESSKLSARARAAQKGLISHISTPAISSDGNLVAQAGQSSTNIVSGPTQDMLTKSATCFGALADEINAKQASVNQTRQRCLQSYPALRAQIIHNILDLSFSEQYLKDIHATALPLLQQLDAKASDK